MVKKAEHPEEQQGETLGQRIRATRLKLDLSQMEFAERLGVSTLSVIRWELDKTVPRDDEVQQELIRLCGLRLADFKPRKKAAPMEREKPGPVQPASEGSEGQQPEGKEEEEYVEVVIAPITKIYRGWHARKGEYPRTRVTVDGRPLPYFNTSGPPPFRIEQDPETETVYEWGYAGVGPAKLAESILADFFGEVPPQGWISHADSQALQYGGAFKWEVINSLPYEEWELTGEEIYAWLLDVKHNPEKHKYFDNV